jgi:hypothetical protein
MIMGVFVEKLWIDAEGILQVKGTDTEHRIQRNLAVLRLVDFGDRIHTPNALLQLFQDGRRHQIHFIQQNHIRESNLLLGFATVPMLPDVFGIDDGDNGV